jgi:hypothetical protein
MSNEKHVAGEIQIFIHVPRTKKETRAKSKAHSADRADYRTQDGKRLMKIPVGMPKINWDAWLRVRETNAQFSHARWCARRIASYIETMRRGGAMSWKRGGHADPLSVDECVEYIRLDQKLKQRLGIMQVSEPLVDYAYQWAKRLVAERLAEVRA